MGGGGGGGGLCVIKREESRGEICNSSCQLNLLVPAENNIQI